MARTILAVLLGVVVAWLTIVLFQFASTAAFPPPPGLDPRDPAQLRALIDAAPPAAMALVLASWAIGAFDGALVTALVARRHRKGAALLIGVLVLAGVVAMIRLVPHPLWMSIAGVLLPVPAAWLAYRFATRLRPVTPTTTT